MADFLPAPFMWACTQCTGLLDDLAEASALTRDHDVHDGAARGQLMLANHLASQHPGEIPEPHEGCHLCAFFEESAERQGMNHLWLEHRARDLFLPESVARLM